MQRLIERWSAFSGSRRGKVWLSILLAMMIVGAATPVLRAAWAARALADQLIVALAPIDLDERSPEAVGLLERGEFTLGGVTYGGPRVRALVPRCANGEGMLVDRAVLAGAMVRPTLPGWAPSALIESTGNSAGLTVAVLALSLGCVWTGLATHLVLIGGGSLLVALACMSFGRLGEAVAAVGIGALALTFFLSVGVVSGLLSAAWPTTAIAATVMREAQRQRISVVFIGVLLVLLPMLPLWIDAESPLRYQIQTFISRGCSLVFAIASVMTLLLACSTVAFEMRDRQIWQLLTKPVSRVQYMAGKWLGIMAVNTCILFVGAACIYGFVQYLSIRPASDPLDARAVREEVLVARQGQRPEFEPMPKDRLIELVDQEIDNDPVLAAEIESGERDVWETRQKLAEDKLTAYSSQQRAIPAGQGKAFTFRGVAVPAGTEQVTLAYTFHLGQDDSHKQHPVIFRFADGSWIDRKFVPIQSYVLPVPASLIDANGDLTVEILSVGYDGTNFAPGDGTIAFDPKDLEVLYSVGTFAGNFARAMIVEWMKLAFLAMLGVAAATILSFPIACLLAFTIFMAAQLAPFIQVSVEQYRIAEDTPILLQWVQLFVKAIAFTSQWLLGAFGAIQPVESLVQGRSISAQALAEAIVFIGLGWTGMALGFGWLGFRRKELAIYSGVG